MGRANCANWLSVVGDIDFGLHCVSVVMMDSLDLKVEQ